MAFKCFFVIIAFCVLKFDQMAAEDNADLGPALQDALNKVTNVTDSIMSLIEYNFKQAQDIIRNYTVQAAAANEAAEQSLESLLQTAFDSIEELPSNTLQDGWNSTLCVLGQKENTENIVQQAANNISICILSEIQWTLELFEDMTTIINHATEVSSSVRGEVVGCFRTSISNFVCLQEVIRKSTSKLMLQMSSQVDNIYELGEGGIQLWDRLTKCGVEQILKTTAEVADIIWNFEECRKEVQQNS